MLLIVYDSLTQKRLYLRIIFIFFIGTFIYLFIITPKEHTHIMQPYTTQLHRESKKTRHLTLAHNFTKYWPIFKILSLLDSVGNL